MRIGQLAQRTQLSPPTIRYYEEIGLLAAPRRTPSGYRDYDEKAAERLDFVKAAQKAGLTLTEIRGIFDIRAQGDAPCRHVASLLEGKLRDIDVRIQALHATRNELQRLNELAERLDPAECGPEEICRIITRSVN